MIQWGKWADKEDLLSAFKMFLDPPLGKGNSAVEQGIFSLKFLL